MGQSAKAAERYVGGEVAMSAKPLLRVAGSVLAFMLILSAWAWWKLPADALVPVHWGVSGEPDRYSGKLEALGVVPLAALVLAALFAFVPRIDPRRLHVASFKRPYFIIASGTLVFLAAVHAFMVAAALGNHVNMKLLCSLGVGVLFVVTGNFMGKIRSNWFVGIRTPWTLSSEVAWQRTHRVGGPVMVATGLVWIAIGVLDAGLAGVILAVGLTLISSFGLVVYSYMVWRHAPDRKPDDMQPPAAG